MTQKAYETGAIPIVIDKSHLIIMGEKLYPEKTSLTLELVNFEFLNQKFCANLRLERRSSMTPNQTNGDHYNCACPHCGKNNHHVSDGVVVECGKVTRFSKPCFHCKKTIFYMARHEIMVSAYSYDLLAKIAKPEPKKEPDQACPNCGNPHYVPGESCFQCGAGPLIGAT